MVRAAVDATDDIDDVDNSDDDIDDIDEDDDNDVEATIDEVRTEEDETDLLCETLGLGAL